VSSGADPQHEAPHDEDPYDEDPEDEDVTTAPEATPDRDVVMREAALRFGYLRRVVLVALSRVLAQHDMTPPGYHVLFRLATEGGELPQQEVVLDLDLDAAGVSRLLSRMVDQGLLTTKVDPEDRRRRIVQLTARGRRLQESLSPEVDAAARRVVTGLTPEEERQLLALLDKTVAATRELHAKKP